jgi:hypothetical protein
LRHICIWIAGQSMRCLICRGPFEGSSHVAEEQQSTESMQRNAHSEEAMKADGQGRGELGDEPVRVEQICGRVQKRRETCVHRQKRRHRQQEGPGPRQVQVQYAPVQHEEGEGSWEHHTGGQEWQCLRPSTRHHNGVLQAFSRK